MDAHDRNQLKGFATYGKADGSSDRVGEVAFGYEATGHTTSTSSGFVQVQRGGGLKFGVSTSASVILDMEGQKLTGVLGGAGADMRMLHAK